ncbi:3-ketosteroid 1-dehydrogenase helE [Hyphodiscus hymeniophilus]|uniref:3-ketosteroid 1-dehydrogenase helE n=1 Tax=Hyphodiscus hymeniophilus TaxID=353542 RepID=A0A9P7AXY6_9HELO|nr:3-ketosteroid 1-dehydrogenase helE [Hyphodiscus hymeniophilus]
MPTPWVNNTELWIPLRVLLNIELHTRILKLAVFTLLPLTIGRLSKEILLRARSRLRLQHVKQPRFQIIQKSSTSHRTFATIADNPKYDYVFDVIVVGSGAGGLTAAVTATLIGKQKVLVVEKTKWFGGTSAYSGGAIWAPLNPLSLAQGFTDSREEVVQYLKTYLKDDYDEPLISAYLDSAPEMIKFLEAKSAAKFMPCMTPDYYMDIKGAKIAGRTLLNLNYDGRRLGALVKQVRYPLQGYSAFGSLQVDYPHMETFRRPFANWGNFAFVTKRMIWYTVDLLRYGKGTELTNGNALVGRLLESATKCGVELWNNSPAAEAILEKERVVGMIIRKDGRELRVRARKGVALASGGFGRSAQLSRKYLPNPDWSSSPRGNQGDGMRIGVASGGNLPPTLGDNAALWSPLSEYRAKKGPARKFPILARTSPNLATHAAGVRREYFIGDHRHLRRYGMGVALPSPYPIWRILRRNYFISAATIPELAVKLSMDPEILSGTIERFNGFARTGKDLDFGRGNGYYDQTYGDPDIKPNSCLAPIEKGPFYALPMYPGSGITMYGLETNEDAQVLTASGRMVPGLYAFYLQTVMKYLLKSILLRTYLRQPPSKCVLLHRLPSHRLYSTSMSNHLATPHSGVIYHVTIKIAPSNMTAFLSALRPCWAATRKDPECLYYEVFHSSTEPGTFSVVEVWAKDEAWITKNHIQRPYFKKYCEDTEHMWLKKDLVVLERLKGWNFVDESYLEGTAKTGELVE